MRILVTIPMSDPEPRTPAPGSLLLVQQFLNSTDLPDGVDELGTPPLAAEWLARVTGVPVTVSEKQHARLVATREALRDLLEAHTGDNVDPGVRVRLQKLLGHSTPIMSLRYMRHAPEAFLDADAEAIASHLAGRSAQTRTPGKRRAGLKAV